MIERMRDGIGFDRDRYFDLSWEHEIAQLAAGPHEQAERDGKVHS